MKLVNTCDRCQVEGYGSGWSGNLLGGLPVTLCSTCRQEWDKVAQSFGREISRLTDDAQALECIYRGSMSNHGLEEIKRAKSLCRAELEDVYQFSLKWLSEPAPPGG